VPPEDKKGLREVSELADLYIDSWAETGDVARQAGGLAADFISPITDGLRDLADTIAPPLPKPAPPSPLKKPLAKNKVHVKLHVFPTRIAPVGSVLTALAEVYYYPDGYVLADGTRLSWPYPDKWVKFTFRSKAYDGSGPHALALPDVEPYTVVLEVQVEGGKSVKVRETIQSVCGAMLPTDPVLVDLTCAVFSEGGSFSGKRALDDRELLAVAWSIRNRYEALLKAQADDQTHWAFFAARWLAKKPITTVVTYSDVLRTRSQYTGVDGDEFEICKNPLTNVKNVAECRRVTKCVEIVDAVFVRGRPEDPFAGQGTQDYPGVFYYKEKGNSPPHGGPLLPEITGKDHHFYLGLDPEYRP
jgi:hypothetical protein